MVYATGVFVKGGGKQAVQKLLSHGSFKQRSVSGCRFASVSQPNPKCSSSKQQQESWSPYQVLPAAHSKHILSIPPYRDVEVSRNGGRNGKVRALSSMPSMIRPARKRPQEMSSLQKRAPRSFATWWHWKRLNYSSSREYLF